MRFLSAYIFFFALTALQAQVAPRPSPQKLYNNLSKEFPDFLNKEEAALLEDKLERFSNETSNQICVVIVDDLNGLEAADYATKIINEWGVGKKGKDNGVVILVKPTGGAGGRDLFIAVGYGLEGAIPDLTTARIRQEMYPYLKSGNNYAALDHATTKLMQLAKGEISIQDYVRQEQPMQNAREEGGNFWKIIFIIIFILVIVLRRRGGGGGWTYGGGGRHWGGSSWGGGGWSGGGGGGWGGFGGGRSGGGGSGGKW